ncbi:MAG: HEAT repeat domain-containing protein [Methylobacter sp.]|nr:HEAT repeat domain-containing protein [Methylobacter sp.]
MLWLFPGLLLAAQGMNTIKEQQSIQVFKIAEAGTGLHLTVRQAPLAKVLNAIAGKTGVPVHYSVLSDGPVTATCAGATIKQVLMCLLGTEVDIVFRYGRGASKDAAQMQPAEVWLLQTPTVLNQQPGNNTGNTIMSEKPAQALLPEHATANVQAEADNTDKLLEQAKDPALRVQAISSLAVEGRKDDVNVRKTLKEALSDKSAEVRAQAVFGLAQREGEGATADLQKALRDRDAGVRLMAVDNAGDNPVLIRQALNDSDEAVRQLAAMKLELLGKADTLR